MHVSMRQTVAAGTAAAGAALGMASMAQAQGGSPNPVNKRGGKCKSIDVRCRLPIKADKTLFAVVMPKHFLGKPPALPKNAPTDQHPK